MSFDSIFQAYRDAGQDHVFKFWDSLDAKQQKALLDQLSNMDPHVITSIANDTIVNPPNDPIETADIQPLGENVAWSLLDSSDQQISQWNDLGLDLIAKDSVAVILLAGGQGTRLGSSEPKGCYNIGLPSGKSLFQLQAERILRVQTLAKEKNKLSAQPIIPWYIMTSGPTNDDTKAFFVKNNYFGLNPENVIFFTQGVLPCLTSEGKIILENAHTVATAPDGNGGIYNALHKGGILDDIKRRQIRHIHTYCVDNCLVRVADPVFLGFAASRKLDIASKVVRKRDANESVGLVVSKNNAPAVVEYSEISKELASQLDPANSQLLRFRAANIVNHYYSADFLLTIPSWKSSFLPFHLAHKKIPFIDLQSGQLVAKPSAANGIKLEQFVFDVFPNIPFDKFASFEVARNDEFSPLKNAPGSGVDCPETSRSDVLSEHRRWLLAAGASVPQDADVEISPLVSYGGENLDSFAGKTISSSIE